MYQGFIVNGRVTFLFSVHEYCEACSTVNAHNAIMITISTYVHVYIAQVDEYIYST